MKPSDVSAIVCTRNSIASIKPCLLSLRQAGVGQVVVVDARSHDGTREVAERLADIVVTDDGTGLGQARNCGIRETTGLLILNMGSDNIMPPGQLPKMIQVLEEGKYAGVSARTVVEGRDYVSRGLNAWRKGRFLPGRADVIGTPTLFRGSLLRHSPYDPEARFSDDSELCERWSRESGATFAITDAFVREIGKNSWNEVKVRCRMYGVSDCEVYRRGSRQGWGWGRKLQSLAHPLRSDFVYPVRHLGPVEAARSLPFLLSFTGMRYYYWLRAQVD